MYTNSISTDRNAYFNSMAVLTLLLLEEEEEVGVVIGDLRRGVLRRLLLLRGVEDRESRDGVDGVGVNIVKRLFDKMSPL